MRWTLRAYGDLILYRRAGETVWIAAVVHGRRLLHEEDFVET